jgi:hypothetical protein
VDRPNEYGCPSLPSVYEQEITKATKGNAGGTTASGHVENVKEAWPRESPAVSRPEQCTRHAIMSESLRFQELIVEKTSYGRQLPPVLALPMRRKLGPALFADRVQLFNVGAGRLIG